MRIFKNSIIRSACLVPTLASVMLMGCGSDSSSEGPSVITAKGLISGVASEGSVASFKGIPYGAAPIGDKRFAPPQPVPAWDDTLHANEFGSDCPQVAGMFGSASTNEDCLFLNVYTPDVEGEHPVMVWIHGGALIFGSGGATYNPEKILNEDVVLVTLNYRLGALGFLAHSDLSTEMGSGSGNFGLMDQQLALTWVQDNIELFGGNPENVTIFGESAGGHSVLSQLASNDAAGLFHKAIVQSGAYSAGQMPLPFAEAMGASFAQTANCNEVQDTLACLRALPVDEILKAQEGVSYIPNTGTDILPLSISAALETGEFNQVPVMTGSNLHEGRLFVALDEVTNLATLNDDAKYRQSVAGFLSPDPTLDTDAIATRYLALEDSEASNKYSLAYSAIQTDAAFACTALGQMFTLSAFVDTYSYHFTDENAPSLFPPILSIPLGAAHAYEIQYLLDSEQTMLDNGAGNEQMALATAMVDYWTTFAKTGNPNPAASALPIWSTFSSGTILDLNPTLTSKYYSEFSNTHSCGYWEEQTNNL